LYIYLIVYIEERAAFAALSLCIPDPAINAGITALFSCFFTKPSHYDGPKYAKLKRIGKYCFLPRKGLFVDGYQRLIC
jgi:hypothetical protein